MSDMTGLKKMVRRIGLEPSDLNLDRLQARAEQHYAAGATPIEAYSLALGCDLSLTCHGGRATLPLHSSH